MTKFRNDIITNAKIITEDGEVFEGIGVLNPETKTIIDKEVTKQRKKYFAEKKNYEAFNDLVGGFTFMLAETITSLHKDTRFSDTEKARIIYLGTYCSYETSGRYLKFANNVPILKSHLQELLELSNNKQFYAFYNKLVQYKIITEEIVSPRETRLLWSAEYHFKGTAKGSGVKSTDVIKTYDKQVQAL